MKASIVRELGNGFEIAEISLATPIGREVRVEVKASGLCHSDESVAEYGLGYPVPMVLGHEAAGVVIEVGPAVTQFAVGDHVAACLAPYCGTCEKCAVGKPQLCLDPAVTLRGPGQAPRLTENGVSVEQAFGLGGFAQEILVHENMLAKIPDEMPWAPASLLGCGVVTGAGAVLNAADVQPSDTVVVIGAGGVGLNAVTAAVLAGSATIIAVDIADEKLARATRFGATHTVNSSTTDPVAAVMEITGVGGDAVFDFVGVSDVMKQGFDMVAPGGALYLIGANDPSATITTSPIEMFRGQKRIVGVNLGDTIAKRDIPLYAQLYLQGRFELDELVSKEISLREIDAGYASLKDPVLARVVVTDFE